MANVLVGNDVAAYSIVQNGLDGFPGPYNTAQLLGVWESITVNLQLTRSDVTPSRQLLEESRLTKIHWTAVMEHSVRSLADSTFGGPIGIQLLTTQNFNVIVQFQEEQNGYWWTLFGGISSDEYKRAREKAMDTLSIQNIGPVGTTSASLWWSPTSQAAISQIAGFQPNSIKPTTTTYGLT